MFILMIKIDSSATHLKSGVKSEDIDAKIVDLHEPFKLVYRYHLSQVSK